MKKFRFLPAFFILKLTLIMSTVTQAEVRFANVFNNGAVLQREMQLPIWGWAEPGEKVVVTLGSQRKETQADGEGRWQVTFEPQPAGGPFQLTAEGSSKVELKNVLIGEVWVGVGQSNMMMGVGNSNGGKEALEEFERYPLLRMAFNFGKIANTPEKDVGKAGWGRPNASSSATSFYFARGLYDYFKGEVPIGILNYTEIRPAEAWIEESILAASPLKQGLLPPSKGWDATRLYNGVVHPLTPLAFRGVLYYQGEMNGGNSEERFSQLMTMVIESWRKAFARPEMPFLFVQLPGYVNHRGEKDARLDMAAESLAKLNAGSTHGFVGVRAGFDRVFHEVPYTGMAVTIDVGDPWNIHPREKRPVGERLALQARRIAYGDKEAVTNGPFMKSCEFSKGKALVTFNTGGANLELRPAEGSGFELAGRDGTFHPADGAIVGNGVVEVSSKVVSEPIMVRYAWGGHPPVSLFNTAGLPAAPFQHLNIGGVAAPSKAVLPLVANFKDWKLHDGAVDKDGVIFFPEKKAFATVNRLPVKGFIYNARPYDNPGFVRPGMLMGLDIEAATEEGALGRLFVRLSINHNFYDQLVEVVSSEFERRRVVLGVGPNVSTLPGQEYLRIHLRETQEASEGVPVKIKGISALTLLRPELGYEGPATIDFLGVPSGEKPVSAKVGIYNAQQEGLVLQVKGGAEPTQRWTVLYGMVDAVAKQRGVMEATHIGGHLTGEAAEYFVLEGENVTEDGKSVRLLGADGKPGLRGGPEGEREEFKVRFKGAEKPGTYKALLRIVTQAANLGVLSQEAEGEPVKDLHYLDIPVTATVAP